MRLIGRSPEDSERRYAPRHGGTDDQSTVVSKTQRRRLATDGLVAAATLIGVVAITGLVVLFGWGEYFAHQSVTIVIGIVASLLFMIALGTFYRRFVRDRSTDRPDERDLTRDEQS